MPKVLSKYQIAGRAYDKISEDGIVSILKLAENAGFYNNTEFNKAARRLLQNKYRAGHVRRAGKVKLEKGRYIRIYQKIKPQKDKTLGAVRLTNKHVNQMYEGECVNCLVIMEKFDFSGGMHRRAVKAQLSKLYKKGLLDRSKKSDPKIPSVYIRTNGNNTQTASNGNSFFLKTVHLIESLAVEDKIEEKENILNLKTASKNDRIYFLVACRAYCQAGLLQYQGVNGNGHTFLKMKEIDEPYRFEKLGPTLRTSIFFDGLEAGDVICNNKVAEVIGCGDRFSKNLVSSCLWKLWKRRKVLERRNLKKPIYRKIKDREMTGKWIN